jgi:hypothetical protein
VAVGCGDAGKLGELGEIDGREGGARGPPAHPRLDLGGRAVGDDPTVGHEDGAVGVGVGLLEIVGGEKDRLTAGGELAHDHP